MPPNTSKTHRTSHPPGTQRHRPRKPTPAVVVKAPNSKEHGQSCEDCKEVGPSDKNKIRWKHRNPQPVWRAPPMIRPSFDSMFDLSQVVTVDTSHARSNIDVVRMCVRDLHWKEFPFGRKDMGPCDIYWHGSSFFDNLDIHSGKINKFPGMGDVTRKINLCRTLDLIREIYPDEYDFYPQSWFLPHQFHEFAAEVTMMRKKCRHRSPRPTFIVKPDDGCQGDGIYLIKDPSDYIIGHKCHIVQQYLSSPFLLEGFKFDLRVYVVIVSLKPLKIYLCKEGLARFCTLPYQEPRYRNIKESYMHLTNYSLNKHSQGYIHTDMGDTGSKRTMTSVFRKLDSLGYDSQAVWREIENVIVKTLLAISPELQVEYHSVFPKGKTDTTCSCFQILGFDILLLDDLKPMLLEINAQPSLRIDYEAEIKPGITKHIPSAIDEEVKKAVVKETMLLVAPEDKIRPKTVKKASGRRKSRQSSVYSSQSTTSSNGWFSPISFHYNHDNQESITQTSDTLNIPDSNGNQSPVLEIPGLPLCDITQANPSTIPEAEKKLYEIYPEPHNSKYEPLTILDRVAAIFTHCLGCRGTLRMGPTGFRMFTRRCHLNSGCFTNAAIDILFIELQRKWSFMNPDRTAGLCFHGFVDAFYEIARRKFRSTCKLDSVKYMIEYCETNLKFGKHSVSRNLPNVLKAEKKLNTLKSLHHMSPQRGRTYFFSDSKS